jgi:hypothetical protein
MKRWNWVTAGFAAIAAICAAISFYFALVFHFATGLLGSPSFTVDQALAALTVTVTLVGLLVAIAAIGIAIAAIFGYSEIRQITSRKTDQILRGVIIKLRKNKDISSIEAQLFMEMLVEEDITENEPKSSTAKSNVVEESDSQKSAQVEGTKKYPPQEGVDNGNHGNKPEPPK